ncbi:hypothetical protein MIR68_005013 [Amoeboaphelidium protococcarum]|nr:hypothetical protein MIR68_005013 [Amoeboaphelidium protococcarum]
MLVYWSKFGELLRLESFACPISSSETVSLGGYVASGIVLYLVYWYGILHSSWYWSQLQLSVFYPVQVTTELLRYLYAVWCLLLLRIKYINAAEPLLSSNSSSCCISILFLIQYACSSMLCSLLTILTLLKLLNGSLKLFPSLLLSRTQLRLPPCPGAKSLQLTGADGSTHSATGFVVYDIVCWFAYHWFLAVGHGYQIGLVEVLTVIDVYGQLNTFDYRWHYVGVNAVRPVTVGPLNGALCLSTIYPTALLLVVPHTWTLPRLLAVLHTWVFCLFSVSGAI